MLANSVSPSTTPSRTGTSIEYSSEPRLGCATYDRSVCQNSPLPPMRWPFSTMLETRNTSGWPGSRYLATTWISRSPKPRLNATCSKGVSFWFRKTSTECRSNALRRPANTASGSGCEMSSPVTSLPSGASLRSTVNGCAGASCRAAAVVLIAIPLFSRHGAQVV